MAGCRKCGGKKIFRTIMQDGGVCYGCDGTGDEKLAKERRATQQAKNDKNHEQELKQMIAEIYIKVQQPKLLGGESRRETLRADAKGYYKVLKEKFNVVLSLDEIKEIAKGL